jgi:hypothetical protein
VIEAFPNMFLGSLCDMDRYPEQPTRHRKWTDTLFPLVRPQIGGLLQRLLPGRQVAGRWSDDHEEIAGFTCAVTALCMAAGEYTAVGAADDGWIILPPRSSLGAGWVQTLTECCQRARRSFPGASIVWNQARPECGEATASLIPTGDSMEPEKPAPGFHSNEVLRCPIPGCTKTWPNGRGGWDRHVEVLGMHRDWHPSVSDPEERKRRFKREFPEFFR